jgi:tetratricopeptide (TPR) repeat protein
MAQTRMFVSHSSKDNDWARPFAAALTAIGYDVWYDETGIQGGAAWVSSIQHEVETREVFLLVLTPEAWESKWVQDELQLAIATRRRILPVLLRNTQVSGFLLTKQWITVIGEEPQAAARAALLAIEAPPAPGRDVASVATTDTLDDLVTLCRSLAAEERWTEALAVCARTLALDPKNINVLKVKAWALHEIGDVQLEGQTLFQILLIAPEVMSPYSFDYLVENYSGKILAALDDESEVLQAYSLLRSNLLAAPHEPYKELVHIQSLLGALNRLNRLELATDLLRGISDISGAKFGTRLQICRTVQEGLRRHDYAIRLIEIWYGSPPGTSTVNDIPILDIYAQSLIQVGRAEDARRARESIVRTFEKEYGRELGRWFRPQLPSWSPNHVYEYKIYLGSLEATGRTDEAQRLRKAYPSYT